MLFLDVCPTLESTFKYVFEQLNIEPERELNELTNIENDIVQYLAGFVSKKVGIMENCDKCSKALLTQNSKTSTCKFIYFKTKGFLFHPNDDAILISVKCEQVFKMLKLSKNLFKKNLLTQMILIVMKKMFVDTTACFLNLDWKNKF